MAEPEDFDIPDSQTFVPAVYARSEEEAEVYRELLEDHGIEVLVGYEEWEDYAGPDALPGKVGRGVPVLVLDSFLDEASEIIADREGAEDDLLEEDEDEDEEDEDEEFSPILDAGSADLNDSDEDDYDEEEDEDEEDDDEDEDDDYYDEEEDEYYDSDSDEDDDEDDEEY